MSLYVYAGYYKSAHMTNTEMNKEIALFMGYEYIPYNMPDRPQANFSDKLPSHGMWKHRDDAMYMVDKEHYYIWSPKLPFDTSWHWLMYVLSKMQKKGFAWSFTAAEDTCIVFITHTELSTYHNTTKESLLKSAHEVVYRACKAYNSANPDHWLSRIKFRWLPSKHSTNDTDTHTNLPTDNTLGS